MNTYNDLDLATTLEIFVINWNLETKGKLLIYIFSFLNETKKQVEEHFIEKKQ